MDPWCFHHDSPAESVPLDLLPRFAEMASSQYELEVQQGVLLIRKLLEVKENPPIQSVVDAGVCERLVACMQHADSELQLNASLALGNIISSDADPGMQRNYYEEQTSNVAGRAKCRNRALEAGAMSALLNIIRTCPPENLSLLRAAVKAVANLCRFKPVPELNHIAPAIPILALTVQHPDIEIASDSLWAFSYICDEPQDRVQLVIGSGVVPLIINILDSPNENFLLPALYIVGNICSGTEVQTQVVIDAGCLRSLVLHLNPQRPRSVRKETLWLLSNICAGSTTQIQAVIEIGLLPAIVSTISAPEAEVKKEALWTCAVLTSNGTYQQIMSLVEAGALEAFFDAIDTCTDKKTLTLALECIFAVVESGAELLLRGIHVSNIYVDRIRSFQGESVIEGLLSHSDAKIRSHAESIFHDYIDHEQLDDEH